MQSNDVEGQGPNGYDVDRTQSANCVPTTREVRAAEEHDAHVAPNRSSTEPSSNPSPIHEKGKPSTGASDDTVTASNTSSEDSVSIRKRMIGQRNTTGQGQEIENTPSNISRSRSRKSRLSKHIPVAHQVRAVFWSWPNILLVCVPVGIALSQINGMNPLAIFIVGYLVAVWLL